MKTAEQQAKDVAAMFLLARNRETKQVRTHFRLVRYPGTLVSGFAVRFYDKDDLMVEAMYIGNYCEPHVRMA